MAVALRGRDTQSFLTDVQMTDTTSVGALSGPRRQILQARQLLKQRELFSRSEGAFCRSDKSNKFDTCTYLTGLVASYDAPPMLLTIGENVIGKK